MNNEENPQPEIPLKDRMIAQLAFFKKNVLNRLGLTPKETEVEYDAYKKLSPDLKPEERQIIIRDNIFRSLAKKKVLATNWENFLFYKDKFRLEPGSAPELYMVLPGGGTMADPNSHKIKIYLNPYIADFLPDYQVYILLEEAIHYFQLKHSGRTEVNNQDEREAKDKILRMADFLSLSEARRKFLRDARERYGHD